jgi:hypothetical protein
MTGISQSLMTTSTGWAWNSCQAILGQQARMALVFDGALEHQTRQRIVFGDQHVHEALLSPPSTCS